MKRSGMKRLLAETLSVVRQGRRMRATLSDKGEDLVYLPVTWGANQP